MEVNCYFGFSILALSEMEKASLQKLMHNFCLIVFENVVGWGFFPHLLFRNHISGGLGALALLIMQNSLS